MTENLEHLRKRVMQQLDEMIKRIDTLTCDCNRWKAEAMAAREIETPDGRARMRDDVAREEYAAARAANGEE